MRCESIRPESDEPSYLESRYAHLLASSKASSYLDSPQGFYFALSLFNSEWVLPQLVKTLLTTAALLGPENVHVSIFENGSQDKTPLMLSHAARAFTAMGVEHSIRSDVHHTNWSSVGRIEQLAVYRNVAIEAINQFQESTSKPLFRSSRRQSNASEPTGHPVVPTDLIFINDVYLCPSDILELLHQRRIQNASATCGLDWRSAPEGVWDWAKGYTAPNYRFYDSRCLVVIFQC